MNHSEVSLRTPTSRIAIWDWLCTKNMSASFNIKRDLMLIGVVS
jgi:hypothetical protein